MKLAIAGTGYVGLVAGVCFAEVGHSVMCVDIDKEKIKSLKEGKSPIYEKSLEALMEKNYKSGHLDYTVDYKKAYKNADAIFIGVGTPENFDGSADLTYVASVARQIAESIVKDCLIVVKSTVPVGTNDKVEQFINEFLINDVKIEVASNPEFLAQGNAVEDTLNAQRIVIGTESERAKKILHEIYAPFDLPIVSVSRKSAEMIKYASNDFLALKISYMNELANLCELVGANIEDVEMAMAYDKRIGAHFLKAGVGFGGSCFPKDTKALKYLARQNGYNLKTIDATIEINNEQKLRLYRKACERLITFKGLKVAVLGLTFKPETDDLREAPALENVKIFLEQGANIYAYDPIGEKKFEEKYPAGKHGEGTIFYMNTPESALESANVCFIFTEWQEIKNIEPKVYFEKMSTPLVYDGRNIYKISDMEKEKVEYYSIGRPNSKKY